MVLDPLVYVAWKQTTLPTLSRVGVHVKVPMVDPTPLPAEFAKVAPGGSGE
jgi:hypothetical protein